MRPIPSAHWPALLDVLASSPPKDPWVAQLTLVLAAESLFAQATRGAWVVGPLGPDAAASHLVLEVHTDTGVLGVSPQGDRVDLSAWKAAHPQARFEDPQACLTQMRPTGREVDERAQRHTASCLTMGGVGLCFEMDAGLPLDIEDFACVLMQDSCHPEFGRSIARDLLAQGVRCTTVMAVFYEHWPKVAARLIRFGVRVRLCWPRIASIRLPTEPVKWPDEEACAQAQGRLEAAYRHACAPALDA